MRTPLRLLLILLAVGLVAFTALAQDDDDAANDSIPLPDLPLTSDYTYIIEAGDTLDVLSALFDVQQTCLRETNGITTSTIIQPGDELLIDTACPAYDGLLQVENPRLDAPGRTGEDGTYVVQRGDTLDVIGQTLDVSVISLRNANDLDVNGRLTPGQVLIIPDDGVPYGVTPALPPDEPVGAEGGGQGGGLAGEFYIVQPGDTLDTIGQAFDISVVQLRLDNGLDRFDRIFPGQELVIAEDDSRTPYGQFPALPVEGSEAGGGTGGGIAGEEYVIQPNDTLDTIGQAFDISVVQLRLDNGLDRFDRIFPGQVLIIAEEENRTPYGQFPALPVEGSEEGGGAGGGIAGEEYVIQPNDTLDTIGQAFDISVVQLRVDNGLARFDRIFPGQVLIIAEERTPYGQFPPIIETEAGGGGGIDVVTLQPQGTIDQIAQAFDVSTACIVEGNGITNTRLLQPGTQIVIPSGCPPYTGVVAPTAPTDDAADDAAGG